MHIDANAHVGPTVYEDFEFEPTLETLEERYRETDIDGAVVSPLKPPSFDFDAANERLASQLEGRDNWYPIGRIDPRVDAATTHVRRALAEYDCHGIKLHPWEETYPLSSSIVDPVLETVADYDVPVWIHAGYPNVSHALSVKRIAERYSDIPFVLTHSSQLDISGGSLADVLLMARETDNTYFELSGIYRHDFIQDIVEIVGAERVLFGSNAPYYNPQVEKSRVTHAAISETQKESLLGKSIKVLL